MALSRERLAEKAGLRTREIELESLDGETVLIRELKGSERAAAFQRFFERQETDEVDEEGNPKVRLKLREGALHFEPYLVCCALLEKPGKQMYGPDEEEAVSDELRNEVIQEIAGEVMALSGLRESAEETAGN